MQEDDHGKASGLTLKRVLAILAVVFTLVVAGVVVTAIAIGDREELAFDYEGFD